MNSPDALSQYGKVAIITGSAKGDGIGAGIAMSLARAGAMVVINHLSDSSSEAAKTTAEKICAVTGRNSAIVVQADLRTPEGAAKVIHDTLVGFGVDHIDIIVNNAFGGGRPGPAIQMQPQDLHNSFAIAVYGPLYLLQNAMPYMCQGGRVINIGSVASKLGQPGTGIYGAAKAAMDALTFTLSRELGRDGKGITVNTIMPGPVPTTGVPSHPQVQAAHERLRMMTRADDRLGQVEDIADAVLLLASEKSRWITGQVISVSGGITGGC